MHTLHLEWLVIEVLHGSDNCPLNLHITTPSPIVSRHSYWITSHADRTGFSQLVTFRYQQFLSVNSTAEHFTSTVLREATQHVPQSSTRPHRIPILFCWWTDKCHDTVCASKWAVDVSEPTLLWRIWFNLHTSMPCSAYWIICLWIYWPWSRNSAGWWVICELAFVHWVDIYITWASWKAPSVGNVDRRRRSGPWHLTWTAFRRGITPTRVSSIYDVDSKMNNKQRNSWKYSLRKFQVHSLSTHNKFLLYH